MIDEEIGKVHSTDLLPVCVFHHRCCLAWGPLQLARDKLFSRSSSNIDVFCDECFSVNLNS